MFWFYLEGLARLPRLALQSFAGVEGWFALAIFLVMFFNKKLGRRWATYRSFDRKWAIIPVTLYFFYLILESNYVAYQELEKDRKDSIAKVEEIANDAQGELERVNTVMRQLTMENAELQKGAPVLSEEAARVKEIRDALIRMADSIPSKKEFNEETGAEWKTKAFTLCEWIKVKSDNPDDSRPMPVRWFEAAYDGTYKGMLEAAESIRASALNISEKDLPE